MKFEGKAVFFQGKWMITVYAEEFGEVFLLDKSSKLLKPVTFESEEQANEYIRMKEAEPKKAATVYNGLLNVPDIRIEYQGYTIQPKRDFGGNPYFSNGNVYKKGYIVVQNGMAVMPGATWSASIVEAKAAIDSLIDADGDIEKFWDIMREKQGRTEWSEV